MKKSVINIFPLLLAMALAVGCSKAPADADNANNPSDSSTNAANNSAGSGSMLSRVMAPAKLTIPAGTPLTVRLQSAVSSASAQSGDIAVSGTQGEVEARSQSGDVKIEDVSSRVDIGTLSGDIEVHGVAKGDVQIKSVSGDIRVNDFQGDFEGETVSGSIELRGAAARSVRSHTTSGDLVYEGTIDPSGRYELIAHSGDIKLNIPSSSSAQLSVSTWSGTLDSDFPITLRPGEHGIGSSQAKRFTFDIGNGDARISAETFSGDITIGSHGSSRRDR